MPLLRDGVIVRGLGISGVRSFQDGQIAQAGANASSSGLKKRRVGAGLARDQAIRGQGPLLQRQKIFQNYGRR